MPLDLTTITIVAGLIPDPIKLFGFSLHLRAPLMKALQDGKLTKEDLPFAVEALPEGLVPIQGRMFPLKDTLTRILADGKFGLDDLMTIFAAWSGALPAPHALPAPGGPVVGIPSAPAPWAPAPPPAVPNRPAGLHPAELVVRITRITVSGPGRIDAPTLDFDAAPRPDGGVQIVLKSGHDSLDDGSKINLDAGVEDLDGNGILIDETHNPELLGMLRWRAVSPDGSELLGAIGGAGMNNDNHVEGLAHFVNPAPPKPPGQWKRSGGMSVTVAVRAKAVFSVGFHGGRFSAVVATPDVR